MLASTPSQIEYFRISSIKQMIKMEKLGMKTRGGNIKGKIAVQFGLKKSSSHDDVIKAIEARQKELLKIEKSQ